MWLWHITVGQIYADSKKESKPNSIAYSRLFFKCSVDNWVVFRYEFCVNLSFFFLLLSYSMFSLQEKSSTVRKNEKRNRKKKPHINKLKISLIYEMESVIDVAVYMNPKLLMLIQNETKSKLTIQRTHEKYIHTGIYIFQFTV